MPSTKRHFWDQTEVMRCVRIAFPEPIRNEILTSTQAATALTEGPAHEFLFPNPAKTSFLQRMDAEHRQDEQFMLRTWRVRHIIYELVARLAEINTARPQQEQILVALHECRISWRIMLGQSQCRVRVYPPDRSGHGPEAFKEFTVAADGDPTQQYLGYEQQYTAIRDDANTIRIKPDSRLDKEWPSLFKSNLCVSSDDYNEQTFPLRIEKDKLVKVFQSEDAFDAECAWLSRGTCGARSYFRPVLPTEDAQKELFGSSFAIGIRRIDGINADELLVELQQNPSSEDRDKIELIANELVAQGLAAVRSFHEIEKVKQEPTQKAEPYPWKEKVLQALSEVRSSLPQDQVLLNKMRDEIEKAAAAIDAHSTVGFRDAHLKNRIVKVPDQNVAKWISEMPSTLAGIRKKLKATTYDIDFESTQYRTNTWDDMLHVISCPHNNLPPSEIVRERFELVRKSWTDDSTDVSYEVIAPCFALRCLREFFRRLFYWKWMRHAHEARYGNEPGHYYLDCVLETARVLSGQFKSTHELLSKFKKETDLPDDAGSKRLFTVRIDVAPDVLIAPLVLDHDNRTICTGGEVIELVPNHFEYISELWTAYQANPATRVEMRPIWERLNIPMEKRGKSYHNKLLQRLNIAIAPAGLKVSRVGSTNARLWQLKFEGVSDMN